MGGTYTVVTESGTSVDCDVVMYATGRKGKIEGLELDKAVPELKTEGSFIPVDEYSKTNIDNIYAVGDITNRMALTPVALMEGHCLADTVFGGMDRPSDHKSVASTVFTSPELGTVGYTEAEAASKFKNITVYKTRFRPMMHSFPKSEMYTMMKVIVDTSIKWLDVTLRPMVPVKWCKVLRSPSRWVRPKVILIKRSVSIQRRRKN